MSTAAASSSFAEVGLGVAAVGGREGGAWAKPGASFNSSGAGLAVAGDGAGDGLAFGAAVFRGPGGLRLLALTGSTDGDGERWTSPPRGGSSETETDERTDAEGAKGDWLLFIRSGVDELFMDSESFDTSWSG